MTDSIRVRASVAVVRDGRILLVPHHDTEVGPVQWVIPGGSVRYGEGLQQAALREFEEEAGLQAGIVALLSVNEVILPQRPWHSITVTFSGYISAGDLTCEEHPKHGTKMPQWLSADELRTLEYHPRPAVEGALGIEAA